MIWIQNLTISFHYLTNRNNQIKIKNQNFKKDLIFSDCIIFLIFLKK